MKRPAVLLPVIICLLYLPAKAQETAFKQGEKITYTVFYNVIGLYINAGTATFTTTLEQYNNANVYHVVGEGATNSKYDWIFKVRDRYESYFNTTDLEPVKFIRNINEGSFKMREEVAFNQKTNTAVTTSGVYKIPPHVQDVINAIYFARNQDYSNYKPGDKITVNIFLDNKVYNLYLKYLGKETIKTRYGRYNAIKLSPQVIAGTVFKNDDKMTMWVTDDSNHIPVRVESPIAVGSIKIDLREYENVKYPLSVVKN